MSNFNGSSSSPIDPEKNAIDELLSEVAKLCVLSQISNDLAIDTFRREISRVSNTIDAPESAPVDPFVAGQALGKWHHDSRFLDRDGQPARLRISTGQFSELCRAASDVADENRVLELLVQAGAVSVVGDVAAASCRDLIVGAGIPGAVARAVDLATAFSRTLVRNLTKPIHQPSRFERTVVNSKLAKRHVPALFAYLSVHGQSFLEDIDSWMSSRESMTDGPRVGVGLYVFEE